MSQPPTSFRYPFQLDDEAIHPQVAQALRYAFSGILDAHNAIVALNNKTAGAVAAATRTSQTAGGVTETITANVGNVNNQSGNTAYSLAQSDFGSLIILNTSSTFALTISAVVMAPFYCVVENLGSASAVATPATGAVNNLGSFTLIPGQSALFYFDGTNWWATTLPPYLLGGSTGFGAVVLDSAPFIISPTLNGTILIDSGSLIIVDSGCTIQYDSGVNLIFEPGSQMQNAFMTGVTTIMNLQVYSNNAAAVAGGLTVGKLYRTGGDPDIIATVH
jgi:hypothetical protein